MRAVPILLTVLLVLPMTGSLMLPPVADRAPGVDAIALSEARRLAAAQSTPPLPADLPDAQLLILLAALDGIHLELPAKDALRVAPEDTIPTVALRLAHRAGALHATPADFAMFDGLDPRAAGPVLTLLVALELAWDLRDEAFAAVPTEDMKQIRRLALDEHATREDLARAHALADPMDREALLRAALLLLDTIESIVVPALEDAVAQQAWPADATYDDVGVLRLGGTGNDVETRTRIVQIDPRGDDSYYNNAGATTVVSDLDPSTLDAPVGLSLDFAGSDVYEKSDANPAQGAAAAGIGILQEYSGSDTYSGVRWAQGADLHGVGWLHDHRGDDEYASGQDSIGTATLVAVLRDDLGSDHYRAYLPYCGGFAFTERATGLLWDRAGMDSYHTSGFSYLCYGWGEGGRGWLVDEGVSIDTYDTARGSNFAHGCNDCEWWAGGVDTNKVTGRGNDNAGGLSYVLATQPT